MIDINKDRLVIDKINWPIRVKILRDLLLINLCI